MLVLLIDAILYQFPYLFLVIFLYEIKVGSVKKMFVQHLSSLRFSIQIC